MLEIFTYFCKLVYANTNILTGANPENQKPL